jgi:hypothetical protein
MFGVDCSENRPQQTPGNARPPPRGNFNNNWQNQGQSRGGQGGGRQQQPNNGQRQWNNNQPDAPQGAPPFNRGNKFNNKKKPQGGKGRGGN